MTIQTEVTLAPLTTFHIGGPARAFSEACTEEDVEAAILHAQASGLPLFVLGAGSNVLVPDTGIDGVVVHMCIGGITLLEAGEYVELVGGAGMLWEEIVDVAIANGLYGIENLAGIPGTLGGAAVQNIGAYGAEFSLVFAYADVIDSRTREKRRISGQEAAFAYRTSLFKEHPELVILRVALRLAKHGALQTSYADIARAVSLGARLMTPLDVADAVRRIRSQKFPSDPHEGTAGSFFKNPVVTEEKGSELGARFPGLPTFPQPSGKVKVSLAWILDHALALKGYAQDRVRLYEKQPLVVVAEEGARSGDVDALASFVAEKVFDATGIMIEREVETFGVRSRK